MASNLPADIYVRLRLPSDLTAQYEEQAAECNISLEELLELRLSQFVELRSSKPLVFTDEDRRTIESLLGKNVSTPTELIYLIRKSQSIRIGNKLDSWSTRVELKPNLIQRLQSRCFGKSFDEFLKQTIVEGLERYVGIR